MAIKILLLNFDGDPIGTASLDVDWPNLPNAISWQNRCFLNDNSFGYGAYTPTFSERTVLVLPDTAVTGNFGEKP